jgi:hypothetical protein
MGPESFPKNAFVLHTPERPPRGLAREVFGGYDTRSDATEDSRRQGSGNILCCFDPSFRRPCRDTPASLRGAQDDPSFQPIDSACANLHFFC